MTSADLKATAAAADLTGWWLVIGAGCWRLSLVAGGRLLVVGCWWLVADGLLPVPGCSSSVVAADGLSRVALLKAVRQHPTWRVLLMRI